jgi:hypothetical protein
MRIEFIPADHPARQGKLRCSGCEEYIVNSAVDKEIHLAQHRKGLRIYRPQPRRQEVQNDD